MKILFIEPGKRPQVKEISGDLSSMQKLVGGIIQAIYLFPEVALICNDEGKLLHLPMNRYLPEVGDLICGSFFLCGSPPHGDSFTSLTQEQLDTLSKRFHATEAFLYLGGQLLIVRG